MATRALLVKLVIKVLKASKVSSEIKAYKVLLVIKYVLKELHTFVSAIDQSYREHKCNGSKRIYRFSICLFFFRVEWV